LDAAQRDTAPESRVTSDVTRYEIRVEGVLDPGWSPWFDNLHVRPDERGETVIVGPVPDQAALHGLLSRIRDLGLTLLEVRRL
jgi:hypothetical protein